METGEGTQRDARPTGTSKAEWAVRVLVMTRPDFLTPHQIDRLKMSKLSMLAFVSNWESPRTRAIQQRDREGNTSRANLPLDEAFLPRVTILRNFADSATVPYRRSLERHIGTSRLMEVLFQEDFVQFALEYAVEIHINGPVPESQRLHPVYQEVELVLIWVGLHSLVYEYGIETDFDFRSETWKEGRTGRYFSITFNDGLVPLRVAMSRGPLCQRDELTMDEQLADFGWLFGRTRLPIFVAAFDQWVTIVGSGGGPNDLRWVETSIDVCRPDEASEVLLEIERKTGIVGDVLLTEGRVPDASFTEVRTSGDLCDIHGWYCVFVARDGIDRWDEPAIAFPETMPADGNSDNVYQWNAVA